jgi:hypothetical protein
MTSKSRFCWLLMSLLSLASVGCCCTQGLTTCNSCDGRMCASGPLASLASCRSGCGEVYVDEWLNSPPCIDDCGYGNCGTCGPRNGRPLLSFARMIVGLPFNAGCGGCDGGCSSCGVEGGYVASAPSSCNCGGSHGGSVYHGTVEHSGPVYSTPAPTAQPMMPAPAAPLKTEPTPAPVAPSSAKRLSPAQQRTNVARASATR